MGTSRLIISDEERIAAAEALRERAKRPLGKSMQLMFSEVLGLYRTNIGWAKPTKATETWASIVNYLADLIDRGTCRNVYDGEAMGACDNGFECSVCGNRVEDYEHYAVTGEFNYCSKCGRKVVEL